MKHWIMQLLPKTQGVALNAVFRTEESARRALDNLRDEANLIEFQDDFGVTFLLDPRSYNALLTNTDTDAALKRALGDASFEAARTYGLSAVTREPGSTMQ